MVAYFVCFKLFINDNIKINMDYNQKYKLAANLIQKGYIVHCTDADFKYFSPSHIKGGSRAKEGYGVYFSDMPYKPIEYGDIFKVVKKSDFNFINSQDPITKYSYIFNNDFLTDIYRLEQRLDTIRNVREYDELDAEISRLRNEYKKIGGDELFRSIDMAINQYRAKTIGGLEYNLPNPDTMIPKLTQLYIQYGFDGYETDGIYTIFNFDKLNQLVIDVNTETNKLDESIDLSSFEVKNELNPDFWKNDTLDSRVRLKLLDIADDFTDFLKVDWVKPTDITMTGSLANYNWSDEFSDIDLHIIIKYSDVDKRKEFVQNYFKAKKELWNQEHQNIKIYGFPVELYVQDEDEPHASSGVYSLERNEWIVKPEKKNIPKKNLTNAEKDAESWISKIDNLIDRYYPDATDSQKEDIIADLDDIFDDIKKTRQSGLKKKGDEMSQNNLTFKILRRNGYLDKIWDKKKEIYDDLMSINEDISNNNKLYHQTKSDFNIIKSIIKNGLIPQDRNGEGAGIWFSDEPFYNSKTTMFSIPNNEETLRKYNFNPYFDGNIKIAKKRIPFDNLTVENIPFAVANEHTYLYSSSKDFFLSMAKRKGFDSIAEYIAENKNFKNIVIYEDLFNNFVEEGTSQIFHKYPHIKTVRLI